MLRSSVFALALSAAAISPSAGLRSAVAASLRVARAPLAVRATVGMRGPATGREETEYELYMRKRVESGEDIDSTYSDLGVEADFDGGDSGSGAVGDGQVTLDNQHDSPFIVGGGGLRDTVEGAAAMGNLEDTGPVVGLSSKIRSKVEIDQEVKASTSSRDFKQKNYWGRQIGSGYADQLLDQGKYTDRPVLRQQLENWQNQQSLKSATDQSVAEMTQFFGTTEADQANDWRKQRGRPIDSIRTQISVANVGSSERLDGGAWGAVSVSESDAIEETFELYATPSVPGVLEIQVQNEISAFSPFRCSFTADSPKTMTHTPSEGVMEKRTSGSPVEVVVRFNPDAYGAPVVGHLVFETEDFKKVYKIVGMTAH